MNISSAEINQAIDITAAELITAGVLVTPETLLIRLHQKSTDYGQYGKATSPVRRRLGFVYEDAFWSVRECHMTIPLYLN